MVREPFNDEMWGFECRRFSLGQTVEQAAIVGAAVSHRLDLRERAVLELHRPITPAFGAEEVEREFRTERHHFKEYPDGNRIAVVRDQRSCGSKLVLVDAVAFDFDVVAALSKKSSLSRNH